MSNRTFVSTLTFRAVDNASTAVQAIGRRMSGAMRGMAAVAAATGRATAAVGAGAALTGMMRGHQQLLDMSKAQNDLAGALVLNGQSVANSQRSAARAAQDAYRLSMGTAHTAPQVLQAIAEGAKSGLQTLENSMAAIPDLMEGAQAARTPLDQYAESMLGIAMALGKVNAATGQMQNGGIQRLNQMMALYGADAPGKMDRIRGYFEYFAPMARQMNLSDAFITAMATSMGRQNIQAQSAGVAMRSFFNRLNNPTTEGLAVLRRAGINMTDFTRRNEAGQAIDGEGRVQPGLTGASIASRIGPRIGKTITPQQIQEIDSALAAAGGNATQEVINGIVATIGRSFNGRSGFNPRHQTKVVNLVEEAMRAANPVDQERLALAVAKAFTEGRIQVGDLAKLVQGQQTPRTIAMFRELAELMQKYQGQLGNNQLVSGAAQAQFQGYEKAVKSLADQFTRLVAAVDRSGAAVWVLNVLASGLSRVADVADRFADGKASGFEKFGLALAALAVFAGPLGRLVTILRAITPLLAVITGAFTLGQSKGWDEFSRGFEQSAGRISEAMNRLFALLGQKPPEDGWWGWFRRTTSATFIGGIVESIDRLLKAKERLDNPTTDETGRQTESWFTLGQKAAEGLAWAIDGIVNGMERLKSLFSDLKESIRQTFEIKAPEWLNTLARFAQGQGVVREAVQNASPEAVQTVDRIGETITNAFNRWRTRNERQSANWAVQQDTPNELRRQRARLDQPSDRPIDPAAIQQAVREGASQAKPNVEVTGQASISVTVGLTPEARNIFANARATGTMGLGAGGRAGVSTLGTPQE